MFCMGFALVLPLDILLMLSRALDILLIRRHHRAEKGSIEKAATMTRPAHSRIVPGTPLAVLKFGGSVLRDDAHLQLAVHEVYRELRGGRKVVAVVSAFLGQTDELVRRASTISDDPMGVAMLCATGEAVSVGMLTLALHRAGIPAIPLPPSMVGVRTCGNLLDADPIELCVQSTNRELQNAPVVVVPGFVGLSEDGHISLLGRGGSDLTALAYAHGLNAEVCRLLKDVDGVYTDDPHVNPHADRYVHIPFDLAKDMGDVVVQPKAREFAIKNEQPFELGAIAEPRWTHVGRSDQAETERAATVQPLRIGLLGYGTVGAGVAALLSAHPNLFQIASIGVRTLERDVQQDHKSLLTQDTDRVVNDCDILVELIGGTTVAAVHIENALRSGTDVVTANKALVAADGVQLRRLAAGHNATLRYSAAVGGALPAIELVDRLSAGPHEIIEITGILNGTCNFVLDRVIAGEVFDQAVAAAQEAGFAEADPTLDLDGSDVASKLAILMTHAAGMPITHESIQRNALLDLDPARIQAARERGQTLRLIARASRDMAAASTQWRFQVQVEEVSLECIWGKAKGAWNALEVTTRDGTTHSIRGMGAGRWPTAEAVMADLFDLYRHRHLVGHTPAKAASAMQDDVSIS
jgi:homoserine dehydrogenase